MSRLKNRVTLITGSGSGIGRELAIGFAREGANIVVADIDQASSDIVLETYIFRFDEIGRRIVAALQQACSRGVRVRLLVDGVGSYLDTDRLVKELESERCAIRIFHPLP